MSKVAAKLNNLFSDNIDSSGKTSLFYKFLLFSFRVSGAEVDSSKLNNPRRRQVLLAWGVFCWFVALTAGLAMGYRMYYDSLLPGLKNNASIGFIGSIFTEYCCTLLLNIGAHAAILVYCSQDCWVQLWTKLHLIIRFKDGVKQLNKIVLAACAYLVVEIVVLGCAPLVWYNSGTSASLLPSLNFMSQIHSINGLVMYAVSCFIAQLGFKALHDEIDAKELSDNITSKFYETEMKLLKWRQDHLLLKDITGCISKCFSALLFFWITYVFFYFVPCSYYLVQSILLAGKVQVSVPLALWSLLNLLILTIEVLIISVPTRGMIAQAQKLGYATRKLTFSDPDLQTIVDCICTEVSVSIPRITALGLCDIDLSLLPTLVGSTATYLIILCQF